MPDFQLSSADAEALLIALLSLSAERISSRRFEVPKHRKVIFDPQDGFGGLVQRYRCLSCHSTRGSGDPLACDITFEGSRANSEWLYHFLKRPYSMRRTISIAMPIFHVPDDEARLMAEYMSRVFSDSRIGTPGFSGSRTGVTWTQGAAHADAKRGQAVLDAKGNVLDLGPPSTDCRWAKPQSTWAKPSASTSPTESEKRNPYFRGRSRRPLHGNGGNPIIANVTNQRPMPIYPPTQAAKNSNSR